MLFVDRQITSVGVAAILSAYLAAVSGTVMAAATVNITGTHGWEGIPPTASPVLVTNEQSVSAPNSLYYDLAAVKANPGFGGAYNASFAPLMSGVVTLSFNVISPPGSNADFGLGFDNGTDGGNTDPYPDQFGYGLIYGADTGSSFATVKLTVDLDAPGTPYSTTITSNGDTTTLGDSNLAGGQYAPDGEAPVVSEFQIFIGQGINNNTTGPFYFDDVNLSQTLGGATTTVFSDNFDSYVVPPVPEPASLSFLGLGALGLTARRRR